MDNTTFGDDVPEVPTWTGPSPLIILTQVFLYLSLAGSLLCVLLALVTKQWLNQFASADEWGSNIERSRSRQRKLNGLIFWNLNFNFEVELGMLGFSLLLFACAIYTYLSATNFIISIIIFFAIVYPLTILTLFAPATAVNLRSPDNNPISAITSKFISFLCYILVPTIPHRSHSIASFRRSETIDTIRANNQLPGGLSTPKQGPDVLDMHCASWILQISRDKDVQLSALGYLATTATLADFRPTLAASALISSSAA